MNVWILIDGEKQGPVPDYEVRKRIARGDFTKETVGWHEGCAEWLPLARMALFEREFEEFRPTGRGGVVPARENTAVPDGWSAGAFWMRRFWARWLDLHLFVASWWFVLYLAGADIGAVLNNVWMMLLLYLPWVPLEAYLIVKFGTTPGKWLAAVRVVNSDGSRMDYGRALQRALRVYFLGIGMGWAIISLICQSLALFTVRSTGRALWDQDGTHVVQAKPWKPWRGGSVVAAYFMISLLQWAVVGPYAIDVLSKEYPEIRELEKQGPPHLPRRR